MTATASTSPQDRPIFLVYGVAAVTVVLLHLTGSADPGLTTATCQPGLSRLPFLDPTQVTACVNAQGLGTFLVYDILLIASYTMLFGLAVVWGRACLSRPWARAMLSRIGLILAAAPAVADLTEDGLLGLASRSQRLVFGLLVTASIIKWVLLAVAVVGVTAPVTLVGLFRFLLPWSAPPRTSPDVLPGAPAARAAATNQKWFAYPDGQGTSPFPGVNYGVALSGGGIRSAAFCAGVLQVLAKSSWSPSRAQYLTTVSGGGYLGVSTQMVRHELAGAADPDPYALGAPETAHMKSKQRYLSRSLLRSEGLLDAYLTGLVITGALVVGPLVLVGAVLSFVLRSTWVTSAVRAVGLVGPVRAPVAAVVLFVGAAVFWQRNSANTDLDDDTRKEGSARLGRWVAAAMILAGSLLVLVSVRVHPWWLAVVAGCAAAGFATRYLAAHIERLRWLLPFSRAFFSSGWVTVALTIVAVAADSIWSVPASLQEWQAHPISSVLLGGGPIALIAAFLGLEQTWWSPHPMYKRRIARTFAVSREPGTDQVTTLEDKWTYLDEWGKPPERGPQLLVCATANVEDVSIKPKGTQAVPFVFAHDYVGSPELGWWSTRDFRRCLGERLAGDGTLQAATAISGAAVASGLLVAGRIPTAGTGMALFNLRLGVWLPNPRAQGAAAHWPEAGQRGAAWLRRRRPLWLWREVTGFLPSNRRYVYVSDGGHLDNLGLLELLRRRCAVILIADASNDRPFTTKTLDGVLQIAKDHLGVEVERDPDPKKSLLNTKVAAPASEGWRNVAADCVETVHFTYPGDGRKGVIVLAKARFAKTLMDDEDAKAVCQRIAAARRLWPMSWWSPRSLPVTSTVNQWLTDEQYDDYVDLGRAVGRHAVKHLKDLPEALRAPVEDDSRFLPGNA